MPTFVSDLFDLNFDLHRLGIFDAIVDGDSNFFINVILLKNTKIPEFKEAYESINRFFTKIATLLDASEAKGDRFYKEAFRLFNFSEVNGINLGFSECTHGAGFGEKLRRQVINDAYDIIKKGCIQPELFQLVGLFEENIGPDRLSDMIATIIYSNIVEYTRRINIDLGIAPEKYRKLKFKNGIAINPFKGCEVLLLPTEILHELPIARCWDDINRVVSENEIIRNEINQTIGKEWKNWASGRKKEYIREYIFKVPDKFARIIEGYRNAVIPEFYLSKNIEYFSNRIFNQMVKSGIVFRVENAKEKTSLQAANDVISIFKDWVENNQGWGSILSADSENREKVVQRLIHLGAKNYISTNKLDISFEPNAGRGPVDFKVSKGDDKTVIEVKLSTNDQYIHGYEKQIEDYAKAEGTSQRIYVFIDVGNPGRLQTIREKHRKRVENGENPPSLIAIDSNKKVSASKSK